MCSKEIGIAAASNTLKWHIKSKYLKIFRRVYKNQNLNKSIIKRKNRSEYLVNHYLYISAIIQFLKVTVMKNNLKKHFKCYFKRS